MKLELKKKTKKHLFQRVREISEWVER